MSKYSVTLKQLRRAEACFTGYNKLVASMSGEPLVTEKRYATYDTKQPISLIQILDSNGLSDAIWALHCIEGADREIRLFAVWCARQVQHLMQDERSLRALDVAEKFANGLATIEELNKAKTAAYEAADKAACLAIDKATYLAAKAAAYAAEAAHEAVYAAYAAARAADAAAHSGMNICNNLEAQFRKVFSN